MGENIDALNRAGAAWNAGDLDAYLSLYDPAIRLHGYSPEPFDKAGVREFYATIFAALPGADGGAPRLTFLDIFESGDRVACRFEMAGVHKGAFMGVKPTGRAFVLPGITVLQFRNGKAIERWSNADMLGLLVQLGAVPPPG